MHIPFMKNGSIRRICYLLVLCPDVSVVQFWEDFALFPLFNSGRTYSCSCYSCLGELPVYMLFILGRTSPCFCCSFLRVFRFSWLCCLLLCLGLVDPVSRINTEIYGNLSLTLIHIWVTCCHIKNTFALGVYIYQSYFAILFQTSQT